MPRYEYVCPDKHITEQTVKLADAPGPEKIVCREIVCSLRRKSSKTGHERAHAIQSDCYCRRVAKRVEVYAAHLGPGPTTPPR